MELVSKSQADLALQKYEARKAINRLGQQKRYERGVFECQIKKLNGLTTTEESVMVWKGDMTDGKRTSATQLTPFGQVRGLSSQGRRPEFFYGAIVTFGNKFDREYCTIPKEYFKDIKPCYAKWLTHKGAKEFPAFMWSGACFTSMHGGRGYIYVDLGKWDGKDNQRWLPAVQVNICSSRASKTVNRYSPNGKVVKRDDVSFFKGGDNYRKACTESEVEIYYEFFNHKDIWGAVLPVDELFYLADCKWITYSMKKIEGREEELINLTPKASPKSPLIELSLIFDIFRGNMRGILGKDIDDALGVCHDVPDDDKSGQELGASIYLDAVAGIVNDVGHRARMQYLKSIQQQRRTPCKVSGCKSFAHHLFGKDGVCFKHGDKSKKKVCKICKKNLQARRGGLCGPCFKKRNGVITDGGQGKCRTCKVRDARRNGWRCTQCLV